MFTIYLKVECNSCGETSDLEYPDITLDPKVVIHSAIDDWGWREEPGNYHLCESCITSCNCNCGCANDVKTEGDECNDCQSNCHPTCSCSCGCNDEVDEEGMVCDSCAEEEDNEEEEESITTEEPDNELSGPTFWSDGEEPTVVPTSSNNNIEDTV